MRPRDHDHRAARRLAHLEHVDAHAVTDVEPLTGDLLVAGQYGLCPAQANRDRLWRDRVHGPMNHIPFSLDVLLVLGIALRFSQALQDHLLGGLSRDSAKVFWRGVDQGHAAHHSIRVEPKGLFEGHLGQRVFDCVDDFFLRKHLDFAGVGGDPGLDLLGGGSVHRAAIGRHHGRFQRRHHCFAGKPEPLGNFVKS